MTGPYETEQLLAELAGTLAGTGAPLTAPDRADLAELLPLLHRHAADQQLRLPPDRQLGLAAHALALARRVRAGEHLGPLDEALYAEVPPARLAAVRTLLDSYCLPRAYRAPDTEVLLLALHFEAARHG